MVFLKFFVVCCLMLQLTHYGKSEKHKSCFSSIKVKETPKVSVNLTCGMKNISRINSIIFHRPLEKGDIDCTGNKVKENCCNLKATEPICSVDGDQNDEQFKNAMQCQHQRSCEKTYAAKYMKSCNKNCANKKNDVKSICWSRIIQIDYECETEGLGKSNSKFKIYLH